jgi:hypothetical protein
MRGQSIDADMHEKTRDGRDRYPETAGYSTTEKHGSWNIDAG